MKRYVELLHGELIALAILARFGVGVKTRLEKNRVFTPTPKTGKFFQEEMEAFRLYFDDLPYKESKYYAIGAA